MFCVFFLINFKKSFTFFRRFRIPNLSNFSGTDLLLKCIAHFQKIVTSPKIQYFNTSSKYSAVSSLADKCHHKRLDYTANVFRRDIPLRGAVYSWERTYPQHLKFFFRLHFSFFRPVSFTINVESIEFIAVYKNKLFHSMIWLNLLCYGSFFRKSAGAQISKYIISYWISLLKVSMKKRFIIFFYLRIFYWTKSQLQAVEGMLVKLYLDDTVGRLRGPRAILGLANYMIIPLDSCNSLALV